MTKERYAVILVSSVSHALRAEGLLLDAGIACKLIPVPRRLSSDCGVCVRVERSDRQAADQTLRTAGVETKSVHDI